MLFEDTFHLEVPLKMFSHKNRLLAIKNKYDGRFFDMKSQRQFYHANWFHDQKDSIRSDWIFGLSIWNLQHFVILRNFLEYWRNGIDLKKKENRPAKYKIGTVDFCLFCFSTRVRQISFYEESYCSYDSNLSFIVGIKKFISKSSWGSRRFKKNHRD